MCGWRRSRRARPAELGRVSTIAGLEAAHIAIQYDIGDNHTQQTKGHGKDRSNVLHDPSRCGTASIALGSLATARVRAYPTTQTGTFRIVQFKKQAENGRGKGDHEYSHVTERFVPPGEALVGDAADDREAEVVAQSWVSRVR
jgi:hypothetical protein